MKYLLVVLTVMLSLNGAMAKKDRDGRGKKMMGKMWEKMDSNGDGKVSESEFLAAKKEHFKKMDANGDGFVTMDEKKEFHKGHKGKRKSDSDED